MAEFELTITEATSGDLPELLALYQHLNPNDDPIDPAEAQRIFDRFQTSNGNVILCGWCAGALVSSCTLIVVPNLTRGGRPYGLIENVVTHSDHRGRGHGQAMLDAASARSWEQGCYKVMLMTGSRRPSTLAFYERAGFEQSKTGYQKRRLPKRGDA
ncbi:MAG: GNAT family N-acetyltransferase [Pseudomonadota bacterium]